MFSVEFYNEIGSLCSFIIIENQMDRIHQLIYQATTLLFKWANFKYTPSNEVGFYPGIL